MKNEKLEELKKYIEELKLVKVLQKEKVDEGFISLVQKNVF